MRAFARESTTSNGKTTFTTTAEANHKVMLVRGFKEGNSLRTSPRELHGQISIEEEMKEIIEVIIIGQDLQPGRGLAAGFIQKGSLELKPGEGMTDPGGLTI